MAQPAHEIAGLASAKYGIVGQVDSVSGRGALIQQVRKVHGEEWRPQQCGLGDAVVAVSDCPKTEQELPVERILEEEGPSARGIRDAFGGQPREQERQSPCRNREDRDIAVTNTPRTPIERIDYADVAHLDEPTEIAGQDSALELPVLVDIMFGPVAEIEGQDVNGGKSVALTSRRERLLEYAPAQKASAITGEKLLSEGT